jgi:hypothetical protein
MARTSKRAVIGILLALAAIELGVLAVAYFTREPSGGVSATVAANHHDDPGSSVGEMPIAPSLSEDESNRGDRSPAGRVPDSAEPVGPLELPRSSSRGSDLTVLHVRVVAKDGTPLTRGCIDCTWKGRPTLTMPTGRVAVNIAGFVTNIEMPSAAETCVVTASISGLPPARAELAGFRRKAGDSAPVIGRVDRDVSVKVLDTLHGPTLFGSILVNGEARVPDGLEIIVDRAGGRALVNRVDATYVVPSLVRGPPKSVRVESDDSLPQWFHEPSITADGDWRLDLALVSKHKLHVTAVDATTNNPAGGVELACESGMTRHVRKTTDANGECEFRGFSDSDTLTLREVRGSRMEAMPIFSIRLTDQTPDEIRATVRVGAPKAVVWGKLPDEYRHGPSVRYTRATGDGSPLFGHSVKMDDDGLWSFECEVPSEWSVWIGEQNSSVTRVQRVVVERAQEYGPIQFVRATDTFVRLVVKNAPSSDGIYVAAEDVFGRRLCSEKVIPSASDRIGSSIRPDVIDSFSTRHAFTIELDVITKAGALRASVERIAMVDPQVTTEVTIDISEQQELQFRVNGSPPSGRSRLELHGLNELGSTSGERAMFELVDGVSRTALPLPAGTYLYEFHGQQSPREHACARGIASVQSGSGAHAVMIDWRSRAVALDTLGSGIAFARLDGVSCTSLAPELREVHWPRGMSDTVTTVLVPESCEYTVLK